jgi:hypothetical protein
MKQIVLTLLLFTSTLISTHGQEIKKIAPKYFSNIKSNTDPFTGIETYNYISPTYMYIVKDGNKVDLLLKIAVQRAVTKPKISKILIKAAGEIFVIERNDKEFRTREIADVKDTEEEGTKVVKQRNSQRIYVDEFVGSVNNHRELFKAFLNSSYVLIRIEGNVDIPDQKSDERDYKAMRKLYELYEQFKQREKVN